MAIGLLSKENIEKLLSIKQLAVWEYLQKTNEVSTGEIVKKTKIFIITQFNSITYQHVCIRQVIHCYHQGILAFDGIIGII